MKLKPIKANMSELWLDNGAVILFSYSTPVAAQRAEGGFIRTSTRYSQTTSKHITQWLDGRKAETVHQSELDAMLNGHSGTTDIN